MVFGYNRIPIISWLRGQADESLAHAHKAGELITHLGGHPSLAIGPLLETHKHDIGDILVNPWITKELRCSFTVTYSRKWKVCR